MIGLLYLRWCKFYICICICNSICICIVVWLLMILMLYCRQSRCTGSPCKTPSWSRIPGFNLPNTFIPPSSYFISLDLQLSPWLGRISVPLTFCISPKFCGDVQDGETWVSRLILEWHQAPLFTILWWQIQIQNTNDLTMMVTWSVWAS